MAERRDDHGVGEPVRCSVDVALLSDDRIGDSPSGDNEKHGIMLFTSDGVLTQL